MDDKQKNTIRQLIQEKIDTTRKDIIAFQELTKPVSPDNAIGRLTRLEAINSKSINEAALAKSKATLLKLERAMTQIDDPDFGFCSECEEPIPLKRLVIMPESDLCVVCAQKIGM